MDRIPILHEKDLQEKLRQTSASPYFSMYSNHFGGIITDPTWMLIPIDDHVVHRGDGVFETLKCVQGSLYNLHAHFQRLENSAAAVALDLPCALQELEEITCQTVAASGKPDCLVRIIVSRGPGSLGVNPYDCSEPGLYIITSRLPPPVMQVKPGGVSAAVSRLQAKPGMLAAIKSCNYLLNALMKKEAADLGVDFTIGLDSGGLLTEAPTESIAVVTEDGALAAPLPGTILEGTTLARVFQLAEASAVPNLLGRVERRNISYQELSQAKELLVIGTTPNVAAITHLDGRPVGSGKPGPVYTALAQLLENDMLSNSALRTAVTDPA